MKQSSKRMVSMVLALIFIVGGLFIFFDLIQPTYGDLQAKKGKQISAQNFLDSEKTIVDQAKKLIASFDSASQAADTLSLAMPSGPSTASALGQIYGIAQQNGIIIKSISITPPTVVAQAPAAAGASMGQILKPMGTITFQVSGAGSYENIKMFLSQLETNIRLFDITTLSIQGAQPAPGAKVTAGAQDLYNISFAASTHYQLP